MAGLTKPHVTVRSAGNLPTSFEQQTVITFSKLRWLGKNHRNVMWLLSHRKLSTRCLLQLILERPVANHQINERSAPSASTLVMWSRTQQCKWRDGFHQMNLVKIRCGYEPTSTPQCCGRPSDNRYREEEKIWKISWRLEVYPAACFWS